ncbi:MAG: GIY-YIG nuclease family protein [Bacteroidetes bacterium]|nr:GIY-YIG nuclease family protein [Bacteroidota bacterium]
MTDNFNKRFNDHNAGYNKSTKFYAPFEVIYKEEVETMAIGRRKEKYLKSHAGKIFLQKMIGDGSSLPG